jgi:hypothetical protein
MPNARVVKLAPDTEFRSWHGSSWASLCRQGDNRHEFDSRGAAANPGSHIAIREERSPSDLSDSSELAFVEMSIGTEHAFNQFARRGCQTGGQRREACFRVVGSIALES